MRLMEEQGGIAFLLIYFSETDECYYMKFDELLRFWKRSEEGGRKSIRREELNEDYFIRDIRFPFIPYLVMLDHDLSQRS